MSLMIDSSNCLLINGIEGVGVNTFSSILRDFFFRETKGKLTREDYNSDVIITLLFDSQHPACLEDLKLINKTKKQLHKFRKNIKFVALINRMDCGTESYNILSEIVKKEYGRLFCDNNFKVDYILPFSCVYAKHLLSFYEKSVPIPDFFMRKIYYEYANKYSDNNNKIINLLKQKKIEILKFYNISILRKIYEK